MSSNTPNQPSLPEDLKDDSRDVADLWKDALTAYKGIVGFDLERKFEDVEAMIQQGTKEMNNFHKFRHNEKKVDKLRTLFATNLDYIEKGAQQLVAAATPAFPPAAAIGTAITYMLGACRQVSADYDIVVVFFEDMNSFLQRIVILETRLPKYKAYQNCLMDVFTSFLTMCGYAHKYIELGRFKKWITNLLQGEDTELGGARKAMDTRLSRLQSATEFAILGNTEEIQKMAVELQTNQQSHTAMLQEQLKIMDTIQDTTDSIRSDMAKLLKAFDEQKKDRTGEQRARTSAVEQGKPPSAKRIRNTLPDVEGEDHEYHILKETIVKDTCTWIFAEQQWNAWLSQEHGARSLLAIAGHPGSGKSHIGATVYERLRKLAEEDSSRRTCAAHFYFREQSPSLETLIYGVITIINQVVEQSPSICELINAEYLKDEVSIDVWVWQDLVRKLLAPAFKKDSKNSLFVMLDGVDELQDLPAFIEFLKILQEESLRISIALTSRPDVMPQVSEVAPVTTIDVKKEKQMQDLKALIWNRLNTLSALRKFGRYVKQRIADKVEEAAPNMLYAEHMLLHFNGLGREGAVLRNLDKPLPADLHHLYENLVEECYRRTGSDNQEVVNKLLHWVAFSFRPITLEEVTSMVRFWTNDETFDLEEIAQPFAKFVRIGDPGSDAEARAKIQSQGGWGTAVNDLEKTARVSSSPDAIYDDGKLPVKFQERSMRSFFRKPAEGKDKSLRWTPSGAHRQMFLDCAKMACLANRDRIRVADSLKSYATQYLVNHWRQISLEEHSTEEQAEVMEAFGATMMNKHGYATMLEWQGADYSGKFPDEAFEKLAQWARLLESVRLKISEDVAAWWAEVATNPRNCLLHLLKAHVRTLYNAINFKKANVCFKALRDGIQTSKMNDRLIDQARKNFESELGDPKEPLTKKQAALALEGLFGSEMSASGYRAVASILLQCGHVDPAETTCRKAVEKAQQTPERVRSLELMARIRLKVDAELAYKDIKSCLEHIHEDGVPPSLRREALVTKARIEVELEKNDEAASSYMQARAVDPTTLTAGDILEEELGIFSEDEDKTAYMSVLKKWTPLERLTWMTWKYEEMCDDRHTLLRDAAFATGEAEFVIQMYEDSVKYLDNVNAGAPLRCDLALTYLQVCDDLEKTREILDEVLDSGSTGWPYAVTDELPDSTLERAIDLQTDVLYRLFRRSHDPAVKTGLLEANKGLLTRPLALDVPPASETYLFQRRITMARMYLKMGPAAEFQATLQAVIDACIEALGDKVGWNDADNLVFLATALTILGDAVRSGGKLKRAAQILASARFSRLDPAAKQDDDDSDSSCDTCGSDSDDEDGWEDEESETGSEESEEPPTDEGDLGRPDNVERYCDGVCNPAKGFCWWGGSVAYQCLTCVDGFLCEGCYEKRRSGDELLGCRQYCGKDHDYIKAPIEGWRGVKDGKVLLEGEEPVEFGDLLRQIRDELCKEAWESFWHA